MGVNYAEFSPMAKQLLQHHKIKRARLWDVKTGKQLVLFKGHENNIERVLFSPNGQRVLTQSDREVRLWDIHSGKSLVTLSHENGYIRHAEFSPDGERIITAGSDGTVRIWRIFLTTQHLIDYALQVVPKQLTCEERQQFFLEMTDNCCFVSDKNIRGIYEGQCQDDKAYGFGKSIGKNTYEGYFLQGHMQGSGVYTWSDGTRYEGEFEK